MDDPQTVTQVLLAIACLGLGAVVSTAGHKIINSIKNRKRRQN